MTDLNEVKTILELSFEYDRATGVLSISQQTKFTDKANVGPRIRQLLNVGYDCITTKVAL